jgi:hypothetical protein
MMRASRRVGCAWAALLLLLLVPNVARAHAIHTTLTVVTADAGGVTLMIRAFADDFSSSVARHAGRPVPADSSAPAGDVARYLAARLSANSGASVLQVQPCGIRRTGDVYWICARIAARTLVGLALRNSMLMELHADQINIVQVNTNGARRTLLFTRASPSAVLLVRT